MPNYMLLRDSDEDELWNRINDRLVECPNLEEIPGG
jgi:hypothetical protein